MIINDIPEDDGTRFSISLTMRDRTIRGTINETDDGEIYSMLAIEPASGALRQITAVMDADDFRELEDLSRVMREQLERVPSLTERGKAA